MAATTTTGFLARPRAWHAPHELEQLARHVARAGTWTRLISPDLPPAPPDRGPPAVHFKPVAAGEVVLTATSSSLAALLRGTYDDAAAVEMESAGIAQAAHLNHSLPVLSVRGISDHADARKHTADAAGWQHVAGARAAAFTVSVATLALRRQIPMTGGQPSRQPAAPRTAQQALPSTNPGRPAPLGAQNDEPSGAGTRTA